MVEVDEGAASCKEYEVLVCKGSKTRAIHIAEPSASQSKLFVTAVSGLGRLKYSKSWCTGLHINSRSVCWLALRQNRAELVLEVGEQHQG